MIHFHTIGCTSAALIGAATNGHVEVVNYLILNVASLGQYIQAACDAACKMGKMNVIKYAVNMWMCGCSPSGLDDLAMFGDISIVDYLLKGKVLPSQEYLNLASDITEEDCVSLDPEDSEYQVVFDGQSYVSVKGQFHIEFDENGGKCDDVSDFSDLDADLEDEEGYVFDDGGDDDNDDDDSMKDMSDEGDGEEDDEEDGAGSYNIDDEEDSYDRYIRKKKDTVWTCLVDETEPSSIDTVTPRSVSTVISDSVAPPSSLRDDLKSFLRRPSQNNIVDMPAGPMSVEQEGHYCDGPHSTGANSLGFLELDAFCLRSIVGDTKNFETFRNWSPSTWRESIDNSMNRAVCCPDRMMMIPFLFEKLSGRMSTIGVEKACEEGCLDILHWIHSTHDMSLFTQGAMSAACRGGQHEVALWLKDSVRLPAPSPEVAMTAAVKGAVSFLQWLFVTCGVELHPNICNVAASSGNYAALTWLHEFCRGQCAYSVNAVDMAAINGHMEVVLFLDALGIQCSSSAAEGALLNGHMDMYAHLTNLGAFPSHYAVRYAALPWPSFGPGDGALTPPSGYVVPEDVAANGMQMGVFLTVP